MGMTNLGRTGGVVDPDCCGFPRRLGVAVVGARLVLVKSLGRPRARRHPGHVGRYCCVSLRGVGGVSDCYLV